MTAARARLASLWVVSALGTATVVGVAAGRYPIEVRGMLCGAVIGAVIVAVLLRSVRAHPDSRWLVPLVIGGLVLRALFGGAHVAIGLLFYGGAVDFMGYIEQASFDASEFTNVVVAIMMIIPGPDPLGLFLMSGAIGAAASWLLFRAYETVFPDASGRRFVAAMLFLLPSVAFWSILVGKDVWIFLAIAVSTWAFARLLVRMSVLDGLVLMLGLALAFGIRPPIAVALAGAATGAVLLRPIRWQGWLGYLRPVYRLGLLAALAFAVISLASGAAARLGTALTLDAIAERAAAQHRGFALTEAGSQLELAIPDTEPATVARFLPFGMFTLFFRPLPWEAHNALAVFAAAENVFLLGLSLVRLHHLVTVALVALRRPFLLFALLALVAIGVPTSFQWNLGTTARLRTMALPFFVIALAGNPSRRRALSPMPLVRAEALR